MEIVTEFDYITEENNREDDLHTEASQSFLKGVKIQEVVC